MHARQIDIAQRLGTGPVQAIGDWPGVFIRGDEALSLAMQCRALASWRDTGTYQRILFEKVADLLETCAVADG